MGTGSRTNTIRPRSQGVESPQMRSANFEALPRIGTPTAPLPADARAGDPRHNYPRSLMLKTSYQKTQPVLFNSTLASIN